MTEVDINYIDDESPMMALDDGKTAAGCFMMCLGGIVILIVVTVSLIKLTIT